MPGFPVIELKYGVSGRRRGCRRIENQTIRLKNLRALGFRGGVYRDFVRRFLGLDAEKGTAEPLAESSMPPRTIAIGDIHGCSTAFIRLLRLIAPTREDTIVTLGDYVDIGLDSNGVLDELIEFGKRCRLVPLLGNTKR
jgi:hypothetical protein